MRVNVIHLPHRADRRKALETELDSEGITDFEIWPGIIDHGQPYQGISRAHKQIVKHAKCLRLPEILIAEDDLHFTGKGAFRYFLNKMPADFDLYLASTYYREINPDCTINIFSGLTFTSFGKGFMSFFYPRQSIHI